MALCWTVYSHTHTASGRRYIGLTKLTMMRRWNQHVYNSKLKQGSGCRYFWASIRKYGPESFAHEVLEVVTTSLGDANSAEQRWIEHFDTRNPERGFNLATGAHTPHLLKNPWDRPEYRAAYLPVLVARNSSSEMRAAVSRAASGRKLSPEHVAKIVENGRSSENLSRLGGMRARKKPKIHCNYGHSLHDAYVVRGSGGRTYRRCRTCNQRDCSKYAADRHGPDVV